MKIRIPMIVTATEWAAMGAHSDTVPDWVAIDEMCDPNEATVSPRRFFVEVEDPRESQSEILVGTAVPVEAA